MILTRGTTIHEVTCDECGSCEDFEGTFHEVVEDVKRQGWVIRRADGAWRHVCEACKLACQ